MARSLKTSKRRAEILCRRLVFDRARPLYHGETKPALAPLCEFVREVRGSNPTMEGWETRCRNEPTDWAHIVPRRFSVTRCLPANAWALCRAHHELVDRDPEEKRTLVELTIGLDRWAELRQQAYAGLAGVGMSPLLFWRTQEDMLEALCQANAIPTTYRGA